MQLSHDILINGNAWKDGFNIMDDYAAMLRTQEELIENGRMEEEFKNAHRYPLSMKSGHNIMLDTGLAFIHYEHHDELWNIIDRNHAVMLATHPHDSIDQYHDWKPVDSNESCMPASNAISAKSIRVMR